ncbi:unnamed protein product [Euphydryas editha]|nr:unnamed protein product [Euphydryas editha]
MQAWLTKNVPQLYDIIKNKARLKKYSVDKIFMAIGHDVLRLPPYHLDLNPIEMAWASTKGYVSSQNVKLNISYVIDLIKEKVNLMAPEEWKKLYDKVKSIEENYIKNYHTVDVRRN